MAKDRQHKVKKGETLTKIAKLWSHSKWQDIWTDAANAKLRKKRGAPDSIEPGDLLHIPYTLKEKKAIVEAKLAIYGQMDAERNLARGLLNRSDATARAAKLALSQHKASTKTYDDIIAMLKKSGKDIKGMKEGVDIAFTIATLLVSLGKIASLGAKASKATGEALTELNAQTQKEAIDLMKGPVEGEAKKASAKYLLNEDNEISTLGIIVGTLVEAQEKMISPAFWFHAAVQMKDGASWTDVVTDKWERDLKNRIYLVEKDKIVLTKKLLRDAQDATKATKTLQAEARKALTRATDLDKELKALPEIEV